MQLKESGMQVPLTRYLSGINRVKSRIQDCLGLPYVGTMVELDKDANATKMSSTEGTKSVFLFTPFLVTILQIT